MLFSGVRGREKGLKVCDQGGGEVDQCGDRGGRMEMVEVAYVTRGV